MSDEDVRQKIRAILVADFRVPERKITDEATFRGTFGMDSLDAVDFIYLLGKAVDMKLALEDFRDLHTFGAVAAHVAGLVGPRGSSLA
jgi:acyl carrier protein